MIEPTHPVSETKKRILEAACKVFAQSGFQNATVREICTLAGVNVAAINYHFGDKKSLYLDTLKHFQGAVGVKYPLTSDATKSRTPEERLEFFVSQFIRRVQDCHEETSPRFRQLVVRELMEPTEGLDVIIEETIRPLAALLSSIVRELLGKNVTEPLVRLCCASIMGQSLFFFYAEPIITRLFPGVKAAHDAKRKLIADHITRFSLSAIESLAAHKKGVRS
ncbi:MAG TPA: CerR family C-terminal domain-containing protein [Syntrophorhabdaceae bacterium]|nr:CerR family C-terminal domain-containing protein [Syntrophorhabdaceae bacterium]